MRAIGILKAGGPEVLQIVELPDVHAGRDQVRIRIRAVAVNPVDTMLRVGKKFAQPNPEPFIVGMDLAGHIDEIGPDTETDFKVGDPVIAMTLPREGLGSYRENIVLPVDAVSPAPKNASIVEASTLSMNALTARQSLDQLGLTSGQTIAVIGAAGCYGGYVVQLAKAEGLRVIADSSTEDKELVTELGADVVVPRGDNISEQIRNIMPEGVDGLADGSVQNELSVGAIRDGGSFASVRYWEGTGERDIKFHRTSVSDYFQRSDLLDQLSKQVDDGILTLRVAETFSAEQATEAHKKLEAGGTRGRCVILL